MGCGVEVSACVPMITATIPMIRAIDTAVPFPVARCAEGRTCETLDRAETLLPSPSRTGYLPQEYTRKERKSIRWRQMIQCNLELDSARCSWSQCIRRRKPLSLINKLLYMYHKIIAIELTGHQRSNYHCILSPNDAESRDPSRENRPEDCTKVRKSIISPSYKWRVLSEHGSSACQVFGKKHVI